MPGVNPDSTVQVAPPTQSAFAPQPTQAPPPPMQAPQQVQSAGNDPSFAGAIMQLIHSLASSFAPKSITNIKARTDQAVDKASGNDLGQQF